jgi:hypothetical protein
MKKWSTLLAALGALALSACGPAAPESSTDALGQAAAELNTCTSDCSATGGPPVSCSGTVCSASSDRVVCDGVTTFCQVIGPTCTSPQVLCPNGTLLSCTGTSSCGLGSTTCSVQCDGVEKVCANVRPGRECKFSGEG